MESSQDKEKEQVSDSPKRTAFAAVTYDKRLKHVHNYVVESVLKQTDCFCIPPKEIQLGVSLIDQVRECIVQADFIICDLSFEVPNAFYQFGVASALNKSIILISQTPANIDISFKKWRITQYEDTNVGLVHLKERLTGIVEKKITSRVSSLNSNDSVNEVNEELFIQRRNLLSYSTNTRRFAIKFLGEYQDKEAFARIEQIATTETDPNVLRDAFTALWRIDAQGAFPVLMGAGLYSQREFLVREQVVNLLGSSSYVPPSDGLVKHMINQLNDSSWGVRQSVCRVLKRWGENIDTETANKLSEAVRHKLNDPELQVRIAANGNI